VKGPWSCSYFWRSAARHSCCSHSRGVVLRALPPGIFVIVMCIDRDHASVSLLHASLVSTMIVSEVIGPVWIRKIVHFDF
jgi:hypothetical protein